ncbi:DUF4998 domain-containing protein [Parapedobacter sp. 10938]|uniref:DUF4998 domain-containing protein n=1 Tax=Parapedobacter flavus TaxID=3110225 RepID=UPI002DBBE134|nr:DUF4998 domain-containing protein [Parapedobacter sp. 10938]MEC3880519.1 DUF4998 domain-containing protein [Parapedobacter sp. 10938]
MKSKYVYITALLMAILYAGCENANELLDQHLKNGPIVYAGKIDTLDMQSGYYRLRVNIYPAEDVNRSHCVLRWQVAGGERDSVMVEFVEANYDEDLACYYTLIPLASVEGNLLIGAQNVDTFGNRSLVTSEGAFIYGDSYVSTLVNASVNFLPETDEITFEQKIGAVGNLVSYEQANGQFTEEVLVRDGSFTLVDAKRGGILRSKTRYLITETDIDTLAAPNYLETVIP